MITIAMPAAFDAIRSPYDPDRYVSAGKCCRRFGFGTGRALLTAIRAHGIEALAGWNRRVILVDTHRVVDWLEARTKGRAA